MEQTLSEPDFSSLAASLTEAEPAWNRAKMKPWHQELLERMVLRPLDSLKDHAAALGRHEATIQQVTRSDIFLAKLDELTAQRERLIVREIDAKMDRAISEGLERIQETLEGSECDPAFALNAVVGLDKRRRGDKTQVSGGGGAPLVSVSIGTEDLDRARGLIHAHAKSESAGGTRQTGNSDVLLEALE